MNFWDKVTGNDMTREMAEFSARADRLPTEYQAAWDEITAHLWSRSSLTGRNLMPIFDGALGMLEEAASMDQPLDAVLGDDVEGFCTALADAEGAPSLRDTWRKQLNEAVARKLDDQKGA